MADWRAFGRQSLGFMSRRPVASAHGCGRGISRHAFLEVVPEGEDAPRLRRAPERRARGVDRAAPRARAARAAPQRGAPPARLPRAGRRLQHHGARRVAGRERAAAAPAAAGVAERRPHHAGARSRPCWTPATWTRSASCIPTSPALRCRRRTRTSGSTTFSCRAHAERLLACDVLRAPATAASDHFPVVADFPLDAPAADRRVPTATDWCSDQALPPARREPNTAVNITGSARPSGPAG